MHGGTLTASSPGLGRGSTFVVTLPVLDVSQGSCRPADNGEQKVEGLGRRVLVVDDSTDAVDTIAMLLETSGFVVRAAHSGDEALREAAAFSPEIVLLDLGMPGMSGLETCRRMRAMPGGTSMFIVAVTGWGQEQSRRQTQRAGFDAHLVKPVAPDALLSVIEEAPPRLD